MKLLRLTLDSPEANLALDEAILDWTDAAGLDDDILRLWEPWHPCVIVGRASKVAEEVDVSYCQATGIPIRRRCSGGTAIVTAPGCLMYAVIISLIRKPELRSIEAAHCFVLSQMRAALRKLGHAVEIAGISDLALLGRKVSGNSLRCKRDALLYHGTLLYQCPIDLLARCLRSPPRQPDYRQHRSHDEFLANLGGDREGIERAIVEVWRPEVQLDEWPQAAVAQLVRERYSQHEWNFRH